MISDAINLNKIIKSINQIHFLLLYLFIHLIDITDKRGVTRCANREDKCDPNNQIEFNYSREAVDERLKKLEENKNKAKETTTALTNKIIEYIEESGNDVIENLSNKHKEAFDTVSEFIDKLKETQELTGELRKEGENILKNHSNTYRIKENREFVMRTIKRCIESHTNCTTLRAFLESMPQAEITDFVTELKRGFLIQRNRL